jgi:RHS repeat-associated protein
MKTAARPLVLGLLLSLFFAATARAQNNQPPVAQDDHYTVHGAAVIGSVLDNDYDPDGTVLNPSVLSLPSHGTLAGSAPGSYLYTPQTGFTGTDAFSYQVCDNQNACATASVFISVVNARPFGVSDAYVVRGYTLLGHLLANDFDADNDTLSLGGIVRFPEHGTLYGVADPDLKAYLPANGYVGMDSFTYNVCDPYGACTETPVTLYVFEDGGQRGGAENAGTAPCGGAVGEPVSVAGGNMYVQQTDLDAFLTLRRTYNSVLAGQVGLFGRGWSSPWDESVTAYQNGLYRLNLPDGRAVYFAGQGGTYMPVQNDFRATLYQGGDGTFTLALSSGETHRFSAAGRLLSVADRNNNQIALTYDGNNNLSAVTDPYGRALTATTDPTFGFVTSLSDAAGPVANYYYGPSLELQRVEYPDGSMYRFGYTYSAQGLVLATVKDALYNVLESHTYDGYGRAITSERHGGAEHYDLSYVSATETDVTDALSRVTKYTLDKSRGRFVVTGVEGDCGCGGGASVSQSWAYDANLRVTSHTDGLGQTSAYTYDSQGNLLTVSSAGQSTFTYNGFGQVLTATDPAGGVTTYAYDAAGNLLTAKDALNKTTTFTYDGHGRPLTVSDARGKVTGFAYDTSGNLTSRTDAAGGVTSFGYDGRGRLNSATDALSHQTAVEYDGAGRVKKVTAPDSTFVTYTYDQAGRRTGYTDARGNSTAFGYDEAYRLTSVTDAANGTTTLTYDQMSNLTGMTDPSGRTTNYDYDGFNRLVKTTLPPATSGATRLAEQVEYDAGGRVTKTIDGAGQATAYEYDSANRLVKVTDPALKTTQYQYDARSRLTAVVDAINQTTSFTRDALGRVTQISRGGHSESFVYDAVGNRTQRTDFNGAITNYTYDDLNRLTGVSYPDSTQVSYSYDALSRLITATNQNGTLSFAYDSRGRLSSSTDPYGIISSFSYDANGNRTGEGVGNSPGVAPAGATATYGYDALDRPVAVTDAAGATVAYSYDAAGRLVSRSLPNGVVTGYGYDDLDRLTSLTDAKGATVLSALQYQYDAAGHVTQKTDLSGAHTYTYDAVGRLASATHPNASAESYAYDGVGNRTSSHRAASYSYQATNQLASAGASSFGYDADGNLTSKSDGAGTTAFTWDYENRLVGAQPLDGAAVAYKYDALGRLIERGEGEGAWTRFAYGAADVVRDRHSDGSAVEYLNGPGIDERLRLADASGALYFLSDHLRSTTALIDALGSVVEQEGYDSFGDGAGSARTRYGYTGRERDQATGLYYYRARWYDPQQGRFLSEDPAGFTAGVNFYAYAGGNPVTRRDPTGLDWREDDWLTQALGPIAQVSAGFGDTISGGFTVHVREWMNTNQVIIPCSGWYRAGHWMGTTHQVLSVGAGVMEAVGGLAGGEAAGEFANEAAEEVLEAAPEPPATNNLDDTVKLIKDYLGEDATVSKPPGGSDLIVRSADGTKQIRFDLVNSHGDAPHINLEEWQPRNLYPGDKRMIQILNEHIYPKP